MNGSFEYSCLGGDSRSIDHDNREMHLIWDPRMLAMHRYRDIAPSFPPLISGHSTCTAYPDVHVHVYVQLAAQPVQLLKLCLQPSCDADFTQALHSCPAQFTGF